MASVASIITPTIASITTPTTTTTTTSCSSSDASINEKFDAVDYDVCIQSQDKVHFHLHRKNLETNAGAFPGSEFNTRGEAVSLTESERVLEILFQFIYPRKHPTLKDLEFETLAAVAEAAEKYEVFSAMSMCDVRMRESMPGHEAEVLMHALKHGYTDLANETSLRLARKPLQQVVQKLSVNYVVAWANYHDAWRRVFDNAIRHIESTPASTAMDCCIVYSRMQTIAPPQPGVLNVPPITRFTLSVCPNCRFSLIAWVARLERIEDMTVLKREVANASLGSPDVPQKRCKAQDCVGSSCLVMPQVKEGFERAINMVPPFTFFTS